MTEQLSQLMRIEEYLDLQVHDSEKGEAFHGNDSSLTEYYENGHQLISEVIDNFGDL